MFKGKRIALPKTTTEILANVIGYGVFAITIAVMILGWDRLPEKIPAHFNAAGEVDRYGSVFELLILPLIGIVLGIGMELLERYPEVHNYPSRLNDSNREDFYLNSRLMLNLSKNTIFIVFSIAIFEITYVAINDTNLLGVWLLPVNLILIFSPIIYGIVKRMQIK